MNTHYRTRRLLAHPPWRLLSAKPAGRFFRTHYVCGQYHFGHDFDVCEFLSGDEIDVAVMLVVKSTVRVASLLDRVGVAA